jgi:type IV secretory pathway ATPase VirB11/archaellum biosynthesis ATPase
VEEYIYFTFKKIQKGSDIMKKEQIEKVTLSDIKIKKDTKLELDSVCEMLGISKSMFIQTILENEIKEYSEKLKI